MPPLSTPSYTNVDSFAFASIRIIDNDSEPPLTASFSASCPPAGCSFYVGEAITFSDFSQGSPQTWSYDWHGTGFFEDAGPAPQTSHIYLAPGVYPPHLRVVRDADVADFIHAPITILSLPEEEPPLTAGFSASCPPAGCRFYVGEAILFSDSSQGSPQSWSYDWDGDGCLRGRRAGRAERGSHLPCTRQLHAPTSRCPRKRNRRLHSRPDHDSFAAGGRGA